MSAWGETKDLDHIDTTEDASLSSQVGVEWMTAV